MNRIAHCVFLTLLLVVFSAAAQAKPIRVLIISGDNNHNWRQTTPEIKAVLEADGLCEVQVTEQPEQLTAAQLKPYHAIVSNYNTFRAKGEKGKERWSAEARRAYVDFVKRGGGHVVVHAGSSSFYKWPEYQKICLGTWRGGTGHGKHHAFTMRVDQEHPITRGLTPFLIFEELWHKIDMQDNATVLMSSYSSSEFKGTDRWEPSLMVDRFGKGRCVYNVLGHDAAKMKHPAFKALMRRCVQWAATGEVTLPAPKNLPTTAEQLKEAKLMPKNGGVSIPPNFKFDSSAISTTDAKYTWKVRNEIITLKHEGQTVWQFNPNRKIGKPFFHPLAVPGGPTLTWLNPPDHIWHYGLWFNWKKINGVNYWEEDRRHVSKGRTDVVELKMQTRDGGAATFEIDLAYHPHDKKTVMTEKRIIEVAPPDADGVYYMDWNCTFTAGEKDVELSRTPLPDEPGGKTWGGYGGLTLRLIDGLVEPQVTTTEGPAKFEGPGNYQGRAAAMDFNAVVAGKPYGVAICDHPENLNHPTPVYATRGKSMNFFSPAVVCLKPHVLPAGESMTLRYRVIVHPGRWDAAQLKKAHAEYVKK